MQECVTKVVFYDVNKERVLKVKRLFKEVAKYGSIHDYYQATKQPEANENVAYKMAVMEFSGVEYNDRTKEWNFSVEYVSPFRPMFSVILDLLNSIGEASIEYVFQAEELNLELFINTDKQSKYLPQKYHVEIDTEGTNDPSIGITTAMFYATTIEDLCTRFQKVYNSITKDHVVVESYETLIKLVERLKAKNVYVNILQASTVYDPKDDMEMYIQISDMVRNIIVA